MLGLISLQPNTTYLHSEVYFKLASVSAFEVEFPADVMWFKANLNNTGFYRVNYPKHIWDGLTSQLLAEHTIFSTADRAQLINDAFSLSL